MHPLNSIFIITKCLAVKGTKVLADGIFRVRDWHNLNAKAPQGPYVLKAC